MTRYRSHPFAFVAAAGALALTSGAAGADECTPENWQVPSQIMLELGSAVSPASRG